MWSRGPVVLWSGNARKPVSTGVSVAEGSILEEGDSDGFICTVAGPTDVRHLSLASFVIFASCYLFNRFQRSQRFLSGTRNWCVGRRYQCVFFFPPFPLCICVLRVRTYLMQHTCTTLFA